MLAQELLLLLWKGFKLLTVNLTESATEAIRQTQETHHEGSREDTYSKNNLPSFWHVFINITSHSPWKTITFLLNKRFLITHVCLWPLKAKGFELQKKFPIKFWELIIPFSLAKYHKLKQNVSVLLKVCWRGEKSLHPSKLFYIHILCQWWQFKKDGLPSIQLHWFMEGI